MELINLISNTAREQVERFTDQARGNPRRPIAKFAEDEIIVPMDGGPYQGRPYKIETQPTIRHWFEAIDSHKYLEHYATGPSQSGKTLSCFVIPAVYRLFEIQENYIITIPDLNMANNKWEIDIKPVIEMSQYRRFLPDIGPGSQGGRVSDEVRFRNGKILKFMSGRGSDKSRAGFTARSIGMTEIDGYDEPSGTSREADPIRQIKARTNANPSNYQLYAECTVSTVEGAIWKNYQSGTASRIVLQCPYCGKWTSPERDQFYWNREAENEYDAADGAGFACAECGVIWTDDVRSTAVRNSMIIHGAQAIDEDGNIVGEAPKTRAFGFRWSAVHNLFFSSEELAKREWLAEHAEDDDKDNAEKEMQQFVWANPYELDQDAIAPLSTDTVELKGARSKWERGQIPEGHEVLTVGVDVGSKYLDWVVMSWNKDGGGHVVDYGEIIIHERTDRHGMKEGIKMGLRELDDILRDRYELTTGATLDPQLGLIDSRFEGEAVFEFCEESGREGVTWLPCMGFGATQDHANNRQYTQPKTTGTQVTALGLDYHVSRMPKSRVLLIQLNTDQWKARVQDGMRLDDGSEAAWTLFRGAHGKYARQLAAERRREKVDKGKVVVVFEKKHEKVKNHKLDATVYSAVAGHRVPRQRKRVVRVQRPSGQEFWNRR